MRQLAPALLAITLFAGIAQAGVVIEEQQTTERGSGSPTSNKITVMVQGNKQKYVVGDSKQVTDLDQGKRLMIIDPVKAYVEMPFPSKHMMRRGRNSEPLSFQKTGGHQIIAGYACDDYLGSNKVGSDEVTVSGCFSTSAPGADNFTAFQKAMAEKAKGTPLALMSDAPPGIPLKVDTTLTPKAGGRPAVTSHLTVSKVTTQDLPADTFDPPKGYKRRPLRNY